MAALGHNGVSVLRAGLIFLIAIGITAFLWSSWTALTTAWSKAPMPWAVTKTRPVPTFQLQYHALVTRYLKLKTVYPLQYGTSNAVVRTHRRSHSGPGPSICRVLHQCLPELSVSLPPAGPLPARKHALHGALYLRAAISASVPLHRDKCHAPRRRQRLASGARPERRLTHVSFARFHVPFCSNGSPTSRRLVSISFWKLAALSYWPFRRTPGWRAVPRLQTALGCTCKALTDTPEP